MDSIQIIKKPNSTSWDTIHEILYQAHESNRQQGINMRTATLSGQELMERIGPNGQCFVALDGEKVIATASVKFVKRNAWYHKGELADFMLCGILPAYKGKGLYGSLLREIYIYSQEKGINVVELDTAEGNVIMRKASVKNGFKYVGIKASPYTHHYSVILVKWLEGCPFSDLYCRFLYILQSSLYKIRFKRGHIKRFHL